MRLSDLKDDDEIELVAEGDTLAQGSAPALRLSELSPDDIEEAPGEIESFTRGAAQGVTLGFADELVGAAESTFGVLSGDSSALRLSGAYEKSRDESRDAFRTAEQANPYSYLAGEVSGSLASSAIPGLNVAKGATFGRRVAQAGVEGALAGMGLSEEESLGEIAKDGALGATLGAGFQGIGEKVAAPLAGKAATLWNESQAGKKAADLFDTGLKKAGRAFANVPEEYTDEYLKRGGQIAARPEEEILDEISGIYTSRKETLEGAKESYQRSGRKFDEAKQRLKQERQDYVYQARESLKQAEEQLKSVADNLKRGYQDDVFQSREVLNQARSQFDNAALESVEALRSKSVLNLKDDILDSIDSLKQKVQAGSGKAYQALENAQGRVSTRGMVDTIDSGLGSLTVKGQTVSDSAASSHQVLNKLKERIAQLGDEISLPEAKAIIQQLDDDIIYTPGERGVFAPEADAIKLKVRRVLDSALKEKSPEYRAQMAKVAEDAELLSQTRQSMGNEAKVLARLNQLSSVKGRNIDLNLIERLGTKTSKDFKNPIQEYLKVRGVLESPASLKAYKEGLPEHRSLKKAEEAYQALLSPDAKRSTERLMAERPEYAAAKKARETYESLLDPKNVRSVEEAALKTPEYQDFQTAAQGKMYAEEAYEPIKKFGQGSVQAKMRALTGARNYDAEKLFAELDKSTGKKFSQEVKDRAILDSFEKGDVNGSRRTLLGAMAGKAVGASLGGAAGYAAGDEYGAGMGALAGFGSDRYAGKIFKALLDGRLQGPQAINAAKKLGRFAKPLMDAAKRGNHAVAATHFVLSQQDPEYRQLMKQEFDEEE